jgi:heptose-I-phosphate ethanolaminephosphotransferase
MHKAYILRGLFFYPAIFSLIYNLIGKIEWAYIDFAENIVFASIIVLIGFLIPFYKGRLIFLVSTYILISFTAFVETGYYAMYHCKLNMSVVYILFETNTTESTEFFKTYFNHLIINFLFLTIPLLIALPLIFKWNWSAKVQKLSSFSLKKIATTLSFLIILLVISGFSKIRTYNTIYTATKAYLQYQREMKSYDKYALNPLGGKFTNVQHHYKDEEIYVLVIGESANRNHLGLYDYYRKTTPKLEEISDELIVYKDIISPHANTIGSVSKVLSYGNYENPNAKFDGTITQLFNKAGFATYWLSNQEPLGLHETSITRISKASNKRYFTNTISNRRKAIFDEALLTPFKEVLNEGTQKKFIILQLLGSHTDYSYRYPTNFDYFSGKTKATFISPKADKVVNAYDNSILYSDAIISQIINAVKDKNCRSFVLYLSDHGEDIYETSNKAYHAEGVKSRHMFEIPFILWKSKNFQLENDSLVFDPKRPFMTDDLFYSLNDLAGISYDEMQEEKSLFNKKFVPKKRIILETVDYDIEMKKTKPQK